MEESSEQDASPEPSTAQQPAESAPESEHVRIEAWLEAKKKSPSVDARNELRDNVIRAKRDLAAAEEEYATACVESAVVYGYGAIAAEQEVSPKQLHMWQRKYLPEAIDLSKVPEQEMKREERRVADIKRRLARETELKEQLEAYEARMTELKEALHVQ